MITWKKHFLYQVDYQHWANDVLFTSLDHLDDTTRNSPQGLFFDSVHKTIDHMYVVSRTWTARLKGEQLTFSYGTLLCPEWRELKNSLRHEIRDLQRWLDAQPDEFFEQEITYASSNNQTRRNWVRDILTHMMMHMVHHRGQVSAAATRLGAPVPEMDFIYYKREMQDHLQQIRQQNATPGASAT